MRKTIRISIATLSKLMIDSSTCTGTMTVNTSPPRGPSPELGNREWRKPNRLRQHGPWIRDCRDDDETVKDM